MFQGYFPAEWIVWSMNTTPLTLPPVVGGGLLEGVSSEDSTAESALASGEEVCVSPSVSVVMKGDSMQGNSNKCIC